MKQIGITLCRLFKNLKNCLNYKIEVLYLNKNQPYTIKPYNDGYGIFYTGKESLSIKPRSYLKVITDISIKKVDNYSFIIYTNNSSTILPFSNNLNIAFVIKNSKNYNKIINNNDLVAEIFVIRNTKFKF